MEHLPGIILVVSLGLALEPGLDFSFDPGESFDAVRKTSKSLVRAPVNREVLMAPALKGLVNRRTGDMVLFSQAADFLLVLVIGLVDLLSLNRGQARLLVNHHRGLLLR